ncbi:hypothetical protein AA0313_1052 [Acetobacter indonesiensis NRIC 0313]|uniref:Uncharacterized protein n=1 Tax=Acetobacter indonesiensis TaxID=104101 RepID=A0A6N3T0Y8_9PROT|nr:hypothetical protein Abin_030_021 [Acetobacter indonesiensis]GBQ56103.1 hypothetical protein AA0313_1052 [Acetobacter indonesiensis NRIC 0313]GEN02861.1 hypothetical protein AIN02nite_08860 [Acetobacter indonesiensis]
MEVSFVVSGVEGEAGDTLLPAAGGVEPAWDEDGKIVPYPPAGRAAPDGLAF